MLTDLYLIPYYSITQMALEERYLWYVDFLNVSFIQKKPIHLELRTLVQSNQQYFLQVCSLLSLGKCSQAHREQNFGATAVNCPARLLHQGDKTGHCSFSFVTFIL